MQSCKTEPFGTQYVTHEDGPRPHLSDSDQQPSIAQPFQSKLIASNCCALLPFASCRCASLCFVVPWDYCYLQWSRCKRANIQKLKRIHIKSTQKHSKLIPQWSCYANHSLAKGWCTEPEQSSQVIQIWLRYHYHARVSWTPSVLTVASEETISKRMSSLQRSHWWDLGSSCSEPE